MENGEKLFDTFGEYLEKCGDVEFDFFCDDLYCDHTVVWNSYNDKLTEKAKEKWNKLLGSKYEVTYSDDKYRIRQINIPDENLRKSCLDFAYAQAGYIPASEYDELFCSENRICIGNCYVNFGIKTTSLSGETRQDCENLNMTDCMTLYGRIAMNNPVSCETALTVNAVSVAGNTTVPLIVCRKGTFSYVNNWQTDKLLGNEKIFKMIADKAKIEAKSYNKFEEEEPEV